MRLSAAGVLSSGVGMDAVGRNSVPYRLNALEPGNSTGIGNSTGSGTPTSRRARNQSARVGPSSSSSYAPTLEPIASVSNNTMLLQTEWEVKAKANAVNASAANANVNTRSEGYRGINEGSALDGMGVQGKLQQLVEDTSMQKHRERSRASSKDSSVGSGRGSRGSSRNSSGKREKSSNVKQLSSLDSNVVNRKVRSGSCVSVSSRGSSGNSSSKHEKRNKLNASGTNVSSGRAPTKKLSNLPSLDTDNKISAIVDNINFGNDNINFGKLPSPSCSNNSKRLEKLDTLNAIGDNRNSEMLYNLFGK